MAAVDPRKERLTIIDLALTALALGSGVTDVADADASDAESLYRVLEEEVVPLYYNQDVDGLPRKWIAMMKRAIQTLVPEYNSDRMVEEYARRIYS